MSSNLDEASNDSVETEKDTVTEAGDAEPQVSEPKVKLNLDVQITDAGPCKKHLKVSIPRTDVDRQFDESLGTLRKEAAMPGFRTGRAPRSLVQKRYRKEVAGQVKSALLVACMEQLDEDYKLNPITQPKLDVDAIDLPDDGPMKFEMDVEVQPEFELPDYKTLTIKRPVRKVTEADVDNQIKVFLERYAQLVPKTGVAETGDYVTADIEFHKDGVIVNQAKEIQFRLLPELRFQDGHVPELDKALVGAKPGDVREAEAMIGSASKDPALRGKALSVTFYVHDLKRLRLPELDSEFLNKIGFGGEAELRDALRGVLERRFEFQQRVAMRNQILGQLLEKVDIELPNELVARQERSTMNRRKEELRHAGLSVSEIRAREAELRANAHEQTLRSLKEFFLLSKIADREKLKVEDEDFNAEIEMMALRSDESPRRVRSRIEKDGLAEGLVSQILERKALERILEMVRVEDEAHVEDERPVETLDQTAVSGDADGGAEEVPGEQG